MPAGGSGSYSPFLVLDPLRANTAPAYLCSEAVIVLALIPGKAKEIISIVLLMIPDFRIST